jgi:Repeat of unknown function (DUF346)/PQQ-like domain
MAGPRVMKSGLKLFRVGALALLLAGIALVPQSVTPHLVQAAVSGAWTTYHHDDARTGNDSSLGQARTATTGWVSPTLDQEVYAEPLVFGGAVYVATLNDTVYALNQSSGAVLWSKHLGTPQTSGWACGNFSIQGILGTPVIDIAANRIYAVAEVVITGVTTYHLFGLDLANSGNVVLNSTLTSSGFDWTIEQERGALALHGGVVYVPFGGRAGDCGNYHGYVYPVPTSTGTVGAPYVTPGQGMGIWSAGGVVVDDATGNVFVSTGNGTGTGCDANSNGTPVYENDAIARLAPSTVAHQDAFLPQDWKANWCDNDQDLGSIAPVLINSNLMFTAGKWGGGFLLNPNSLGGMDGQLFPTPKPQTYSQAEVCFGNHSDATFGSFAYAAPFVYVECEGQGLVALNVNTTTKTFTPCDATCPAPNWSAGSGTYGPPIVAGGAVWVASDGGGLTAFNATTGGQIYQSAGFGINRFVTPAEAGGQVFVPSHKVIRSFNMVLLNWTSLGGTLTSGPEGAAGSATSVDVFGRGTDNGLWQNHWNGTSWGGWSSLGGGVTADPGAAAQGASRLDAYVRGTDKQLYTRTWNGASWGPWSGLGGVLNSGPDASVRAGAPATVDVFVEGSDGGLYQKSSMDGGNTYGAWQALGGRLTANPGAVSWSSTRIDVFARGIDNQLYHRWWIGATGWSAWELLGGTLTSAPDATSCGVNHLDVYARGTDNGLWHKSWNGSSWSGWHPLGGTWTSGPSAECRPGTTTIDLFVRGTDNALWTTTVTGT